MFDIQSLLLKLVMNKWTWIILIGLSMSFYGYTLYQQNQELKFEKYKTEQNILALRDSAQVNADSIKTLHTFIENLNTDKKQLNKRYVIMETFYKHLIDSISATGHGHDSSGGSDTLALSKFDGKRSITRFSGWTEYNIKKKDYTWHLDLWFDPINSEAQVFLDKTDNAWKIKTTSLTDGVSLYGISTIDEELIRQIKGAPITVKLPPNTFSIGLQSEWIDRVYARATYRPTNFSFSLGYRVYDKLTYPTELWYNRVLFGVDYFIF